MEKNWLDINGYKIAVSTSIKVQRHSPFNDKNYIFNFGNKVNPRGDNSLPFNITLSPADLRQMGYPHLIQNRSVNQRIKGVKLYSNGVQVDEGTLIFTTIDRDINTGAVKCEVQFFNPETDFINAIGLKRVSDLWMDGIRTIAQDTNYLLGPVASPHGRVFTYTGSVFSGPDQLNTTGTPLDVRSSSTSDYATQITLNGDDYISFSTIHIVDSDKGDSWLNFWEPVGQYYPCYYFTPEPDSDLTPFNANRILDLGNHIVPMYYKHQIIRHIFSEFGYTLIDESLFLDDEHFKREVMINTFDILNAMTFSMQCSDGSRDRQVGYLQRTTVINPANHLPGDFIKDHLVDFMTKYNCYFDFELDNKVYLRRGQFDQIARELTDYNPQFKISNTFDEGVTVSYDFPSDKQYDIVKEVENILNHAGTEKVFLAGLNKVYVRPIGGVDPTPEDTHYAIVAEDKNQLAFVTDRISISFQSIDNVIAFTTGIETRPDSPSVNLNKANPDNTNSYALKYPPVSNVYYKPDGSVGNVFYSQVTITSVSNDTLNEATGSITITVEKGLFLQVGLPVSLISDPSGYFTLFGMVTAYTSGTGSLTVNVTSATGPGPSPFNKFTVIQQQFGRYSIYCPIMQITVSFKLTTDKSYKQHGTIGSADQHLHDLLAYPDDGSFSMPASGSSAVIMPSKWLDRSDKTIFESGFYWGLEETTDFVGTGYTLPVMTGFESIYGNSSVTPGWYNLSLQGPKSLISVFWKEFINQYINNRKLTITVYESLFDMKGHVFWKAVLFRGSKIYISEINSDLPDIGKGKQYVGFFI